MAIISIPKPLREKLGEDGSDALVQMLNQYESETKQSIFDAAELRFEKKLTEEISGVRIEITECEKRLENKLTEEISGVRIEIAECEKRFEKRLSEEISGVRVDITDLRRDMVENDAMLRTDIHKSKTDTIKWMFIFWIGQIGALLGILFAVFK